MKQEFLIPGKLYVDTLVSLVPGDTPEILMYIGNLGKFNPATVLAPPHTWPWFEFNEYTLAELCGFLGNNGSVVPFHVTSSVAKKPELYYKRIL